MTKELKEITLLRVVSAVRLRHSPVGVTTSRKNRPRWAIALKTRGKTLYTAGGEQIVSDARHPAILPGGCAYSWICTQPGECLMIEFDAAESLPFPLSFEAEDPAFIKNAFIRLEKSLRLPDPGSDAENKSLVYGILAALLRSGTRPYAPGSRDAWLRPAAEYLEEHFDDPSITNDTLAALCGVSTAYFRKRFREYAGASPMRVLHEMRMDRAKALLESDYVSVAQVAQDVGYNSIYHFSKMFRLYTGMSPTEYARLSARSRLAQGEE